MLSVERLEPIVDLLELDEQRKSMLLGMEDAMGSTD